MATQPTPTELTINNSAAELKAAMQAEAATPTPAVIPDAPAAEPNQVPVAASPVPEWGQLTKNQDGSFEVKLATGEIFKGSAEEVISKQAEAHVNTKRWGMDWKQKAETQPVAPDLPAAPPAETPEQTAERQREADADAWLLARQAKMFGMTPGQYLQTVEAVIKTTQQSAQALAWSDFTQSCQDYVDNPKNAEALVEYLPTEVISRQRPPTAQDLKMAHALALYDHKYESAPAPQAPGRPPMPPAMPSSGAAQAPGEPNPYAIPLADLKKQAFGQ